MSDIEFFSKVNPQRLTTLGEDHKAEQTQILEDQAHWAKYGTNRPKKTLLLKDEVLEELTYERLEG
jgi:hypothetical protein